MTRNSEHFIVKNISYKTSLISSDRVTDLVNKGKSNDETV